MAYDPLPELAVEFWKLTQAFERQLTQVEQYRRAGGQAHLRFARRRLEHLLAEAGLRLATFEGEPWSPAIPASAVNADEVSGSDHVVETTLEPTVVDVNGRVVLPGKLLIREA
jgi:hypothetical protein